MIKFKKEMKEEKKKEYRPVKRIIEKSEQLLLYIVRMVRLDP
jgi:hypothetical protein